ncbi:MULTISPECIES: hypothetical protein [Cyanophyceae]|nr:hypothetical protein [Nodosilinea sp. FACHB-131]
MMILADANFGLKKLRARQLINGSIRVRALDFSLDSFIGGTFLGK